MVPLQATIMILVALGALAVALTTDLVRLVIVSSAYTLPLVLAFTNFVGALIFVRFLADRRL